jgi:hypothetical protein
VLGRTRTTPVHGTLATGLKEHRGVPLVQLRENLLETDQMADGLWQNVLLKRRLGVVFGSAQAASSLIVEKVAYE